MGDDVDGWLTEVERAALDALTARGEVTAAELAAADPRLQVQIVLSRGKSYEGRQNISSRILLLLAAQGRVVRGRPRGSWTSHQYRWAPLTAWCPRGLDEWAAQAAEVELARRWLETFGPATADDLRWWAGWTKTQVRRALTALNPAEVDLDGAPGIVLPGDPGRRRGPSRGRRCCPRLTRRRWAGSSENGSWASTARGCSTRPATSARRCGGMGGSSAAGPRTATARSYAGSWRTPGPTRQPRRRPRRTASLPCSAGSGWPPAPAA